MVDGHHRLPAAGGSSSASDGEGDCEDSETPEIVFSNIDWRQPHPLADSRAFPQSLQNDILGGLGHRVNAEPSCTTMAAPSHTAPTSSATKGCGSTTILASDLSGALAVDGSAGVEERGVGDNTTLPFADEYDGPGWLMGAAGRLASAGRRPRMGQLDGVDGANDCMRQGGLLSMAGAASCYPAKNSSGPSAATRVSSSSRHGRDRQAATTSDGWGPQCALCEAQAEAAIMADFLQVVVEASADPTLSLPDLATCAAAAGCYMAHEAVVSRGTGGFCSSHAQGLLSLEKATGALQGTVDVVGVVAGIGEDELDGLIQRLTAEKAAGGTGRIPGEDWLAASR
jgi:hypothetical protein